MRTALPLVLIVFLFYGCSQRLTYQNIVLAEHLERTALKEVQQKCDNDQQDCALVDDLALDFADRLVSEAIMLNDIECGDSPCRWPDTTDLIIVRDPETGEKPELQFFWCFDPPCDWPDPDKRTGGDEFIIGYRPDNNQLYEFEVVDLEENTIATSLSDNTDLRKDSNKEQLVRARFQLLNPEYSGDARIVIKRMGSDRKLLQTLSVRARVYNSSDR